MAIVENTLEYTQNNTERDLTFTQDAFHRGNFHALQPKSRGNRSGMDALLLAASMPQNITGSVADLGSGAGVAGLALLSLNENVNVLCVERNSEMAELARKTRLLSENSHLRDRIRVLEADVTLTGEDRKNAGLEADSVDHLIMNPPYNCKNIRAPQDAMREEAFMMAQGGLDSWFRTASAIIKPGGQLSMIYRSESLGEVIACCKGRFGNVEIIPIHSYAGDAAKRMIVRGISGSRAGMKILSGFVVHGSPENGEKFAPHADAIFKGESRLVD